jgi:phosphinothricin acetyltransferase
MSVRPITIAELAEAEAIYKSSIRVSSSAVYDERASIAKRSHWFIGQRTRGFPVLGYFEQEKLLGFATFESFREEPAYALTVESSIHVHDGGQGPGIARALLSELLVEASTRGIHAMIAAVEVSDPKWVELHLQLGFSDVGSLRQVARKFDRWIDIRVMQCMISDCAAGNSLGGETLFAGARQS